MKNIILAALLFCLIVSAGWADSLWKDNSSSPYSPQKAYKVGDIVTILILETSAASHKAGTDTNNQDDLALSFTHSIERLNSVLGPNNSASGSYGNKYSGTGKTERSSSLQAKVAATVQEILPNGNLKVSGKHLLEVNDEVQEIGMVGIIRPKDVSINNTVYSYQVAEAQISLKGAGTVGEAQQPGWLTRILNWLF